MKENRKVIIIGGGPAGYTAAIYTARAGLNPLMVAGMLYGGQLMNTTDVENFPGYKNGILGPEMMEDLRQQALRFGTEMIYKDVVEVDFSKSPYEILVDDGTKLKSDSIIISTGANAKYLGLDSEKKYSGYGVSACATCDGFFYRNLDVVVVGGGDTACEEALYLSNICKTVTILVRSESFKASQIMQDRVNGKSNISILFNTHVEEILGDGKVVNGVMTNTGLIECMGVFIAIGHKPNSDIFLNYLETDSEGYIITEKNSTKTNINGIFACGDVQDKIYRQAITAAGTGCMAALDCERYLSNN